MQVGTRLKGGRWHLDKLLATGGFSVVFSATHRNGSRAAIKILNTEFTEDEDMHARFLREGYAANKVGHAGVVRVLDDETEEGRAYLVMELLDGEALDARRERMGGKIPLAEALQIADELLDVLAAAHAQGIIHRDIKPANLFLTAKGQIKVLDFGFAKIKETAKGESTAVGTLLGTPGFLPPERARGQNDEVDARSDIWSAGATIFTLVSGAHVHEGKTPVDLLVVTAQRPVRSLAAVEPGLPRPFIDAIDKALAFDKADRWPSAKAMQAAIREAMVLEDQTKVGPLVLGMSARPATTAIPRLYDDHEDGGTKGFTEVLPTALLQRPAVPAIASPELPHVVAVPSSVRARKVWPLVVGTVLALLGIAFGIASLFPATP